MCLCSSRVLRISSPRLSPHLRFSTSFSPSWNRGYPRHPPRLRQWTPAMVEKSSTTSPIDGRSSHSSHSSQRLVPGKASTATIAGLALSALIYLGPLSSGGVHVHRHRPTLIRHGPLSRSPTGSDWNWTNIKPSRTLEWHPCFDDGRYDCARLDLPIDWQDPGDQRRVVLAIARIRATDTKDYQGPVIFNPGGPGGSGVWSLRHHGKYLQEVVGKNHVSAPSVPDPALLVVSSETLSRLSSYANLPFTSCSTQQDIISFDPRGVGASIPRIQCWESPDEAKAWALQDPGIVDSHSGIISDMFARGIAYGQTCERAMASSSILEHSGTASTARDLLEIVNQGSHPHLKYWGFSYGTVIGGVFAAMYPDRVERLVSDGNVDYQEWFLFTHRNFLHDTDKVMDSFYALCSAAGPDRCAFHAATSDAVQSRLTALYEALKLRPVIIVPSDSDRRGPVLPAIVTYSKVRRLVVTSLYQPLLQFEKVAAILAALEAGDGRPFYEHDHHPNRPETPQLTCPSHAASPFEPLPDILEGTHDAFPGIMCADQPPRGNVTLEDVMLEVERFGEMSSASGAVDAMYAVACLGRSIRPKWRFNGPFQGQTRHPILYVANTADNITPLISARNNSAGFPRSTVLVQNSYGHTSLSAPSDCTNGYIRAYFQNGTLPSPDTECEGPLPFGLAGDANLETYHFPVHMPRF
ncbi:hypothetical protein SODALDRAFT_9550 [Sodiomyces alkalinus F11]|uniref:Uncharacterized protein n=1 Tax=Sodiomyces alkalinus (strain CBS 110278 / VKM F-3762 / F11) TaxID=1314773 RepID=A0A3N2Q6A3_SODAK|nr:hypothetical protein SODALDRAFT_9550 [Sodiomyces alkalinus F11]ROT42188.1 hypothetical protein SODALDRAFT_9550 [Sodiomyces alkalinus F11]